MATAAVFVALDACSSDEHAARTGRKPGGTLTVPEETTVDPDAAHDALGGDEFVFDLQTHFLEYDLSDAERRTSAAASRRRRAANADPAPASRSIATSTRSSCAPTPTVAVVSAIPASDDNGPLSTARMDDARRTRRPTVRRRAHPHARSGAPRDRQRRRATRRDERARASSTRSRRGRCTRTRRRRGSSTTTIRRVPQVGERVPRPRPRDGREHRLACTRASAAEVRTRRPSTSAPRRGASRPRRSSCTTAATRPGTPRARTILIGRRGRPPRPHPVATPAIAPGANVYAELGSTWFNVMRDPDQAAHVLGKLLVAVGPDNLVWGTDSIWYGSPATTDRGVSRLRDHPRVPGAVRLPGAHPRAEAEDPRRERRVALRRHADHGRAATSRPRSSSRPRAAVDVRPAGRTVPGRPTPSHAAHGRHTVGSASSNLRRYLFGWGVMRRYGFRAFQPFGNLSFASSSETAATMITSSPSFQFTGVATW